MSMNLEDIALSETSQTAIDRQLFMMPFECSIQVSQLTEAESNVLATKG